MKSLHGAILAWYDKNKRDLPWRRSTDPYRVWISEIMLQQTRVETVIPYYERFLSNFPSIAALAEADEEKLLNLWAGLGYYSRARNLKAAAVQVMEHHQGKMPSALEDLRSLKGIGPYTAAAISSISFGGAHAAIDGNLERVFARLLALREDPKTKGKAAIATMGEELAALGRTGDMNQAFMDLSSRLCSPKDPKCTECPVRKFCKAAELGIQRELPLKKKKIAPIELQADAWLLIAEGTLLLARRPEGEWLSGMWDLPWMVREGGSESLALGSPIGESVQKRTITKHKIEFRVRGAKLKERWDEKKLKLGLPAPASEYRWVSLKEMHGVNLPRPSERALDEILSVAGMDIF